VTNLAAHHTDASVDKVELPGVTGGRQVEFQYSADVRETLLLGGHPGGVEHVSEVLAPTHAGELRRSLVAGQVTAVLVAVEGDDRQVPMSKL
jgi:hypothetical protein